MKKSIKYLLVAVAVLALGVVGLLAYVKTALPDVGEPETITIESREELIERGRYLANSVMVCMDCHSTRDWSKFSGPLVEGTLGQGGERFDQAMGLPGVIYSKNITPAGISSYTDGELFRLITTGVTKDRRSMFPLMPYRYYGQLDRDDIYAVIAYIRSLHPIENPVPDSELDFPVNFLVNTFPQKASFRKRPEPEEQLAYGEYLTTAAACMECHTRDNKGQIDTKVAFGGGREFFFPDGSVVRSSNITPHETGMGTWTEQAFVERFKMYADSAYSVPLTKPGEFNTIMPWTMYAHMTDEDLKAIFMYLKTVKPIENTVEKFTAAGGM